MKQNEKYLESLTGNTKKDYATYLQLRTEYGNVPVFYFDMSNWFYSHNDKQKALLILSTIAELDLENASLFKTLAYKLKEYGAYKQEVFICKKVLDWRPMDPQSYRDYGLALADAGQYQQALDTLYAALTKPFAQSVMAKSNGIKGVLIHEINQLIALHGSKLNTKSINEPVIAEQPFDIRVVINWNRDNTDIDLHVIDPRGEKCYYSHRNTSIGGMISNDITQGFGPEEFVLEKAIPGTYEIKVKYFGDNQFKAEGPSTIMAEIYTHYATGKQERKVTTLQMTAYSKNNEGLVLIGEFEFK